MKRYFLISLLTVVLAGLSLTSCQSAQDEPWFKLRGIVIAWDDIKNPDQLDWLAKMKETGMNTISVFGHDCHSEEYLALKQKCIDNGIPTSKISGLDNILYRIEKGICTE